MPGTRDRHRSPRTFHRRSPRGGEAPPRFFPLWALCPTSGFGQLATLVAPPAPQPTARGTPTVPTVAAVTRSLGSTAPAPTGLLAPPVDTLTARHAMQPAAFRESRDTSSPTPWSVVARRQPQPNPRPTTRTARYLELSVSKFMFRNKAFPSELRTPIKEHATEDHETLWGLTGKHFRFNYALALATKDRTPLNEQVVNATLRLRDLLDAACSTTDGERWLLDTLCKAETGRANQTESSASDSSATTGQRRRDEPSSGRGNSKRATFSGSDSDTGPHPQRTERDRRQVPPVIFHAVELDGDTPSFPPRIFRPRITPRLPSRAPIPSTVHASEADSAPSLQQMVETVTAAAIAAVDRLLAHMGLCPAPTVPHTDPIAMTAPPHSGRVAYCTPCRTNRFCSTIHGPCCSPHLPRDDLVGYCTPFGRVAYWTPFGRAAYCTPYCTLHSCSTVHGSCDSSHVPRDDIVGYCTPFGRVAYCSPFSRVTNGTPFRTHHPCSTVYGS